MVERNVSRERWKRRAFFLLGIDFLSRNASTEGTSGVVRSRKGKGDSKVEHGQWPDDLLTHISRSSPTKVKRIGRLQPRRDLRLRLPDEF